MEKIRFLGRVWPPGYSMSLGTLPRIQWTDEHLPFPVFFTVSVQKSVIEIECELHKFDDGLFPRLIVRAHDLASAAIDLAAFSYGAGVVTLIEQFVRPDGSRLDLVPVNPALAAESTAFRINTPGDSSYREMFKLVVTDHELFMALRDLIEANSAHHIGVINCGRVLDGIKRMISRDLADEQKKAWRAMQTALNIDESFQKWISNLSANPRHADRSYITPQDALEVIRRTWAIMNRFLEYKRRGSKPLTPPDFPLLTP